MAAWLKNHAKKASKASGQSFSNLVNFAPCVLVVKVLFRQFLKAEAEVACEWNTP